MLAIECQGQAQDCMRTGCGWMFLLITVSASDPFPGNDVHCLHVYTMRGDA